MKRRIRFALFFSGIFLQFVALLGDHATDIPFVLRVVAPRFYHANAGIRALANDKELKKNAEGHTEIEAILREWIRDRLSPENKARKDADIGKIGNITSGATVQIGAETYVTAIWFGMTSSNVTMYGYGAGNPEPNNFVWGLEQLKEKVEDLKRPNTVAFCFGLFFFGTVLDVIAFFMEASEPTGASKDGQDRGENNEQNGTMHEGGTH